MPFEQPWRLPTDGDLAYGVNKNTNKHPSAGDRTKFIKSKAPRGTLPGVTIRTIDEVPILAGEGEKESPNQQSLREALADHPKFKSALNAAGSNQDIRRKCKGGLYWATMIAQKHVHFVLDGIDIAAVVLKAKEGENGDRDADDALGILKNRAITGSELRWVYRNRNEDAVKKYIQFWFNGNPCVPPWISYSTITLGANLMDAPVIDDHDGPTMWAQYRPKVKHVSHDLTTQENLDPIGKTTDSSGCCPCVIQ